MMLTNWLLDFDLVPAFVATSLVGVVLCIRVMLEIAHERIGAQDHPLVRVLRRAGLLAVALALLESLVFGNDKAWQPWPSHLMLVTGLDIWLAGIVVSAYARSKKQPDHRDLVGLLRQHDEV